MPMQEKSKGPDGSVWQFRVSLGRDPITGDYRRATEHFHGPSQTGKQPPKVVRDEYDAFVSRARAGLATGKRGATLNDAWERFLAIADIGPYTRVNYVFKWDKHVRAGVGRTPVNDLSPMTLTTFYRGLVDAGTLSPQTVRKVHANIRSACKTAVALGWVAVSPALSATTPRCGAVKHPELPTPEHIDKLVELADAENPELALFFELALGMGARRGEVVALRRQTSLADLPDGGMVVHVTHAAYKLKGQATGLKDPKDNEQRDIHLAEPVAKMVRAHLARQQMRAHAVRVELAPDAFLFARDVAGRDPWLPQYPTQRFTALWRRVEAATGAPHAKLHDCRHYHATVLLEAGVPIVQVRDRLGHASLETTNKYVGGRKAADVAAAEAFEGRRRPKVVGE